jgi:endoglucanase
MLAKFSVPARLKNRKLRLAGIAFLTAMATLSFAPVAGASPEDTSKSTVGYRIVVKHSGQCLDVQGGNTASGTPLIQWPCHNGSNQRWTFKDMGDGTYSVISDASGKCLDVEGGSRQPGARFIIWPCHGGDNQRFSWQDPVDGWYLIVAKHSGQCMDVQGASMQPGAPVIQWPCHGGDNQRWAVTG